MHKLSLQTPPAVIRNSVQLCWRLVLPGTPWCMGGPYRAGAGMPPHFGWLFASQGGLEVNAGIILRMHPFDLIGRLLEWVEGALRPLDSDFFVLRDGVQVLDHWIRPLAVPCRHLCDTYLENRRDDLSEPHWNIMITTHTDLARVRFNFRKVHFMSYTHDTENSL